jgi:hypothetical protein
MSQSEKSFTVSDRRPFTADGRPREDAAKADAPEPVRAKSPDPEPHSDARDEPADFSGFLLGLAAQAGALLAGEGLPEGSSREDALRGAQSVIAILEMLRNKTEGRRTTEEETLLAELLFQLRMAYVERTRAGKS